MSENLLYRIKNMNNNLYFLREGYDWNDKDEHNRPKKKIFWHEKGKLFNTKRGAMMVFSYRTKTSKKDRLNKAFRVLNMKPDFANCYVVEVVLSDGAKVE